jgi:hypothetical protein
VGNNLEVTASGISDKLIVSGWYSATANRVEEFRLADATSVFASQMPQFAFSPKETFSSAGDQSSKIERQTVQPVGPSPALTERGQDSMLEPSSVIMQRWQVGSQASSALTASRAGLWRMSQKGLAQGGLTSQANMLVSAMSAFGGTQDLSAESERQNIQPVHRLDPTWVTPALM